MSFNRNIIHASFAALLTAKLVAGDGPEGASSSSGTGGSASGRSAASGSGTGDSTPPLEDDVVVPVVCGTETCNPWEECTEGRCAHVGW